mgnify:CR=1 FL=1
MKAYKVVISIDAKTSLKKYIRYLREVKLSPQAARNVLDDFTATRIMLSQVAGSLQEPESEKLKARSLKRINFQKHNYFMLYKVEGEMAIITNIFHGLEDYEGKLR